MNPDILTRYRAQRAKGRTAKDALSIARHHAALEQRWALVDDPRPPTTAHEGRYALHHVRPDGVHLLARYHDDETWSLADVACACDDPECDWSEAALTRMIEEGAEVWIGGVVVTAYLGDPDDDAPELASDSLWGMLTTSRMTMVEHDLEFRYFAEQAAEAIPDSFPAAPGLLAAAA